MTTYRDTESWIFAAFQAEKNDHSYGYHGDSEFGVRDARCVSVHRDATLLEVSNWEVITDDMLKRYPRYCHVESFGHWAVGWIDYLVVRLTTKSGKPTIAAHAIKEWIDRLDDYPIADSDDLSQRESEAEGEANNESIKDFARCGRIDGISIWTIDQLPEDYVDRVWSWLWENDHDAIERKGFGYVDESSAGYLDELPLFAAFFALGYVDLNDYAKEDRESLESALEDYVNEDLKTAFRYNGRESLETRGYRA